MKWLAAAWVVTLGVLVGAGVDLIVRPKQYDVKYGVDASSWDSTGGILSVAGLILLGAMVVYDFWKRS